MRHLFFYIVCWICLEFSVQAKAQNRVRAVSAPGPIEIYEPVIALSDPAVECAIKLANNLENYEELRTLIIILKTTSNQFPIEPHLRIECISDNKAIKSKFWIVWLESITKTGEYVFRWSLDDQQLRSDCGWKCRIEVVGRRAELLCELKEIKVPALGSE